MVVEGRDKIFVMAIVFNITDGKKKKSVILQDTLTIGRSSKNDVVADSEKVSAFHGQFYRSASSIFYKDLNSTNGSFVNDDKVDVCRFYLEDKLRIDGITITIDKSQLTAEERQKLTKFPSLVT